MDMDLGALAGGRGREKNFEKNNRNVKDEEKWCFEVPVNTCPPLPRNKMARQGLPVWMTLKSHSVWNSSHRWSAYPWLTLNERSGPCFLELRKDSTDVQALWATTDGTRKQRCGPTPVFSYHIDKESPGLMGKDCSGAARPVFGEKYKTWGHPAINTIRLIPQRREGLPWNKQVGIQTISKKT